LLGKLGERDEYRDVRISPDGKKVAVAIGNQPSNISTYDLTSGVRTRTTFFSGGSESPIWSTDGRRLAFTVLQGGHSNIYQKFAGGEGREEPLLVSDSFKTVMDWSPDGRYLVYQVGTGGSTSAIWALPLFGDRKPYSLVQEPHAVAAQFLPDGRWLCFGSSVSRSGSVRD
jgi:Tol biopolymer transport system component